MKLYRRVEGMVVDTTFRESEKHGGYSEIYHNGSWKKSGWTNKELKDKRFFKLIGNNFKLK